MTASPVISSPSFTSTLMPYMQIFYISFLATLALTPLMRKLALKHGVVDEPDGRRKIHTKRIAYLGGVAIFIGWLLGVLASITVTPLQAGGNRFADVQVPPGILLGAGIVMICGLIDDVYSLSPRIKLFGQLMAAACLYFLNLTRTDNIGARIDLANMFVYPMERHHLIGLIQLTSPHVYLTLASMFSAIFCVFIVMATSNAMNLLDGMDGLCGGVAGIMAIGYLILSVYLSAANLTQPGIASLNPARIALSLALLGAVLGFLPYNFSPATIFMGDTGSMFLGFICGSMIVLFGNDGIFRWFLASVVIFGLPLLDTLLAVVRRKINRKPIFSPDSGHFHHFLLKRGLSVPRAALVSYILAAMFVSFALVIVIIPTTLALGMYLVLFGWLVVAAFKMGMINQQGNLPLQAASTAFVISSQPGDTIIPNPEAGSHQTENPIQVAPHNANAEPSNKAPASALHNESERPLAPRVAGS